MTARCAEPTFSESLAKRTVPARLQRLSLITENGLCNRLRAIASARRLCSNSGAECSLVWDWGEFASFFDPSPDLELLQSPSGTPDKIIIHKTHNIDSTRTVDVQCAHVLVYSAYVFWGSHELPIGLPDVLPFFPVLSERLRHVVDEFAGTSLGDAVGFHIRRTDSRQSASRSPDAMFLRHGRRLVDSGKKIFLATDNTATQDLMRRSFGDAVITYPKRQRLESRWPRAFDQTATEDDLIELHLLGRTSYVLGSYWSSYSRVAIALNGSPECRILDKHSWLGCVFSTATRLRRAGIRLRAQL